MWLTDIVLGMGEVGSTIFELLSGRGYSCIGIDADKSRSRNDGGPPKQTEMLHVCIPGDLDDFEGIVLECAKRRSPSLAVLVHSTVRPGTAALLQGSLPVPVLSSPARGVHRRFLHDMERYTKFVAADVDVTGEVKSGIESRFRKAQWMSGTKTLEFAKILTDTTYYGWLINYAQMTQMICEREGIDYDEMWQFADEIHQYLGNRPKMYPGIIGGHCVIPNLKLLEYDQVQSVKRINDTFKESRNPEKGE